MTARRVGTRGSRDARRKPAPLDVLAVGAHPDDVELGCGGTLALLASAGRAVGIVHLTSGEAGSRGTAEDRRREAAAAAQALWASPRSRSSTAATAACAPAAPRRMR